VGDRRAAIAPVGEPTLAVVVWVVLLALTSGLGLAFAEADARASAVRHPAGPNAVTGPEHRSAVAEGRSLEPGPDGRQVVLLSYFESADFERLASAVQRAGMPAGVPIYVGSYGVNPSLSERVRTIPGGRYAPMFAIQPSAYWRRRRLSPEEEEAFPPAERFAGVIPPLDRQVELSPEERVEWGLELGRRFRDRLRQVRASGVAIDGWQFDEVRHTAVGPGGKPIREFTRGVLGGLARGRPELADRPERGFVYVAPEALALAGEPVDDELSRFWWALEAACLRFVGEEYPEFVGDPAAVALAQAAGQRALARGDLVRRSLAARYMPGITPGYRPGEDLGGNVAGATRQQVNAWRDAFIAERARHGVAGFAAYHFRFENGATEVMEDVVKAVAAGVAVAGPPRQPSRRAGGSARGDTGQGLTPSGMNPTPEGRHRYQERRRRPL
jgi:hypothetical protein